MFFRASRRKKKGRSPDPPEPWPLEQRLLSLSPLDHWTIKDSFEGTQIFGAVGSGKTSGSGAAIARALLSAGYGGLVLTVKRDETDQWVRYAEETGRSGAVVLFGPGHGRAFNFLDYEARRPGGGSTRNIVALLMDVQRESSQDTGRGGTDPFWDDSLQVLLCNAVDLLRGAGERLGVPALERVISSAPLDPDDAHGPEDRWWDRSFCAECLRRMQTKARGLSASDPDIGTMNATASYWLSKFPAMPDKTRGSILAMCDTLLDGFVRGELRELFSGRTDILPEMSFEGAVIVLDLPIKTHHRLGRAVQILWKILWQRAVEQRDTRAKPRPVFLWADEAHNFYTAGDLSFQTTSRSARAATVYLTQTVSNYFAMIGGRGGGDTKAATDAYLGTLQTMIFHANADPVTNKWAIEYFADRWGWRASHQAGQEGTGMSEQLDPMVLAQQFQRLRRGGFEDRGLVEALVSRSARPWRSTALPYLNVTFRQEGVQRAEIS